MGYKKTSTKKSHSGIRLQKLPLAKQKLDDSVNCSPTSVRLGLPQHTKFESEPDTAFAYQEIPDEVLMGTDLDLSLWSVVATDACMLRLNGRKNSVMEKSTNHTSATKTPLSNQLADFVSPATAGSEVRRTASTPGSAMPLPLSYSLSIVSLNLSGAENITDEAAVQIGNSCASLRTIRLDKATRTLVSGISLQSAAISTIGELRLPIRELEVAGCVRVPEQALLRVFHGCSTLESLDLSFIGAVTDELLLTLGKSCQKLKKLKLRGCRQVSDTGIVALVNASAGNLELLDLTRFDLQYKLNDISLLSIAEKCRMLQTFILTGCDMLTDVGISWLVSGCPALTHLDISRCSKLTDISLRSLGGNLVQLRHLNIRQCVRISDVGIRYVALGCPGLGYLDTAGVFLLSDTRTLVHLPQDSSDMVAYSSSGDNLSYLGISALAAHCHGLRHIDLSNCPSVTDKSLHQLASGCPDLSVLVLVGCHRITNTGVNDILTKCRQLTSLNMGDCEKISDRAFHLVTVSADHHHHHHHDEGQFNTQTGSTIESTISVLTRLVTLRLRNCPCISDTMLKYLSLSAPCLRELDVSGCVRITDIGILTLVESPMAVTLRYLWLRELSQISETGLSWVAEKCTKLLLLDLTGCSQIRSFSIKSLESQWKFTRYSHTDQFKGMMPKHRAEDWLFIEEYGDCWRAAIYIQCMYRACVARRRAQQKREEKLIEWVATCLQSVYRGRQARKVAIIRRLQFNKETHAAKLIQSIYRQRKAMKDVAQLRIQRYQEQIHEAARFIQLAWWRRQLRVRLHGRHLRRLAYEEKLHRAATLIQRQWRRKQARNRLSLRHAATLAQKKEEDAAANKMQTLFRARAARQEVNRKRQQLRKEQKRQEDAALMIQKLVRRRRAQKELRARIIRAKQLNDAAFKIQRRWRNKKRWNSRQLALLARRHKEEYEAATKLQGAWKRKQGQDDAKLLRLMHQQAQQRMVQAALMVQTNWRGKRSRQQMAAIKQFAMEKLIAELKMHHRAATRVQAHYRGRRGRKQYREMLLLKKKRWKEIVQPENGQRFYYNKATGEVRFRRPQDVLDLLPKPLCENCLAPTVSIAHVECRDCGEMFCNTCWHNVHAGGRRKFHAFRTIYDFYDRRIDYDDGDFPSVWPSEIEQDEMDGWSFRTFPKRQPVESRGTWERYNDATSSQDWFYNRETEEHTYIPPAVFSVSGEAENGDNSWAKYYDATQNVEYYYNSRTQESAYTRPTGFVTPRVHLEGVQETISSGGDDDWEKFLDPASGYPYYYKRTTQESTFIRPLNFQTPR